MVKAAALQDHGGAEAFDQPRSRRYGSALRDAAPRIRSAGRFGWDSHSDVEGMSVEDLRRLLQASA